MSLNIDVENCSKSSRNMEDHSHYISSSSSSSNNKIHISPLHNISTISPLHLFQKSYSKKMGGGDSSPARTVVLLGKMGNGKSATANSLLGHEMFESMPSLGGVTSACNLHSTVLPDQRILNVIDTPGLFDSTVESNTMAKEIANCITLAKDGIHAVLLIFSLRSRFSQEEGSAFECLCQIFGPKIADYMIVVFTHGDVLRKKLTLDDFLADSCPDQLKDTLKKCGNRTIVFDNWTEDEDKIGRQREELLSLVETVLEENGGTPYTDELFQQIKIDEAAQGKSTENEINVGGLVEMIESRLKESISNLEKSLAEERAARMEAHMKSLADMAKAEHELNELRERLGQASHRKNRSIASLIVLYCNVIFAQSTLVVHAECCF